MAAAQTSAPAALSKINLCLLFDLLLLYQNRNETPAVVVKLLRSVPGGGWLLYVSKTAILKSNQPMIGIVQSAVVRIR